MKILNVGCGTKASGDPRVVNIDWSMYLVIRSTPLLSGLSRFFLSKERHTRMRALPASIVVHDLRKGLPFEAGSIDVVYHSHFLEHLDRPDAIGFLREVKRVLKSGGVQRIVVPDLEGLCATYLAHLGTCAADAAERARHDMFVADIIEQMVRREAVGTSQQTPVRRAIERVVLGDARKQGQTHQWMYDRISLAHLLCELGFRNVTVERYDSSRIPDWSGSGLDTNDHGAEYKPGSLYVEAAI